MGIIFPDFITSNCYWCVVKYYGELRYVQFVLPFTYLGLVYLRGPISVSKVRM